MSQIGIHTKVKTASAKKPIEGLIGWMPYGSKVGVKPVKTVSNKPKVVTVAPAAAVVAKPVPVDVPVPNKPLVPLKKLSPVLEASLEGVVSPVAQQQAVTADAVPAKPVKRVQPSRTAKKAATMEQTKVNAKTTVEPAPTATDGRTLEMDALRTAYVADFEEEGFLNRLSWCMSAFRVAIGYSDVRRQVVDELCRQHKQASNGKTVIADVITGKTNVADIISTATRTVSALKADTSGTERVFMTIVEPAKQNTDSHYIVVVFDWSKSVRPGAGYKGVLSYFDPSQEENKVSLYEAAFLDPFLEHFGETWKVRQYRTNVPCQRFADQTADFFCQTWSFYFIVHRMVNIGASAAGATIRLPDKQADRFNILLGFIKACVDIMGDVVNEEFTTLIMAEIARLKVIIKRTKAGGKRRSELNSLMTGYSAWLDEDASKIIKSSTVADLIKAEGDRSVVDKK